MIFFIKNVLSILVSLLVAGSFFLKFKKQKDKSRERQQRQRIKRERAYMKALLVDCVTHPTNNNSEKLDNLSDQVKKLTDSLKILGDNQHDDHLRIKRHEKWLISHDHQIKRANADIKYLKKYKVDKSR